MRARNTTNPQAQQRGWQQAVKSQQADAESREEAPVAANKKIDDKCAGIVLDAGDQRQRDPPQRAPAPLVQRKRRHNAKRHQHADLPPFEIVQQGEGR